MVILGSGQALVGTLRLYNPSEEEHEKLTTTQSYTAIKIPEKPKYTSFFIPQEKQADTGTYFADNREDIQNALQTVSPEKAQKIVVRIEQASQNIQVQTPPVSLPTVQTFQSPVRLEVRPDSSYAPGGYNNVINTVVA